MTDVSFPLAGSTLIVGPSQAGKTRLTARALETWVEHNEPEGMVVLEFAPEVERGGEILGGRLDRFMDVPDGAWLGVLDAHAPRSEGKTTDESVALARNNAERAQELIDAAPADPRAVFVNDTTIPYQHEASEPKRLMAYCDRAEYVILNALESDELGTDDPVSRQEREALSILKGWADRTVSLG
ncbi:hypothetical protein [Halocatena salina]|uniref:Uncharacterized protein n=1 Tax=Halocatena salina TaxID=2934340 RepID=A0A8U0AAA5_9EURY|nr:hypothetical protein [Halocatena salina]UPM44883.1 hypothetical protein MW046_16000 [Halocatena salina]